MIHSFTFKFFFRKIYKIVYKRSSDLCSFFQNYNVDITDQVCEIVHHILTNKIEFMKNRTLDQILLSSVYALFKVNKFDIKFRDIIYNYKIVCENNRQLSPIEVGRSLWSIPLSKTENGDLVKFYNTAFIPEMKNYILNIPQTQKNVSMPSPLRQKVTSNVFVSPLRKTNLTPSNSMLSGGISHMTPKTKALFSFGEGFINRSMESHGYASPGISKSSTPLQPPSTVIDVTPTKKSTKRALTFDEDTDTPKNKLKKLKDQ
jgi:hypothetical protein